MVATLTISQIFQVLQMQTVGRLGCHALGKTYVVPITYVFDGKHIYAHSREGQKIEMLRENPKVCFQADIIDSLSNWRSVILWGKYEELTAQRDQAIAVKLLDDRFGPLHVSESISRTSADIHPPHSVEKKKLAVYFRISIDEASGRFERPN